MQKFKKITAFTAILLICAVLIYLVHYINQSPLEKRFASTISKYDKSYSTRIKSRENDEILRIYDLQNNEIGFLTTAKGYADVILIFTQLNSAEITNVEVLYHKETKDYGDLVTADWFLRRLLLPVDNRLKTVRINKNRSNEVIAITGATITSEAVVQAINNCIDIMEEIENEKQ